MLVTIESKCETLNLKFEGTAKKLLEMLEVNAETVLVVKNGELIELEEEVGGDDQIKILSVVSGG